MATETPLLLDVVRSLRHKHFPRGQILLYQGDPVQDVLILTQGYVKMYDIDDQGNEKVLHIFKPYSILPFAFFSGNHERTRWFYTALTDCDMCVITPEKLEETMQANTSLSLELMNWFSQEVHELLVRLSSLGKTNAHDKVLAALRYLATCHATSRRSGWLRVDFPVNHQLLADMTGLTRESTAVIMSGLQKDEKIRNPRQTILEVSRSIFD